MVETDKNKSLIINQLKAKNSHPKLTDITKDTSGHQITPDQANDRLDMSGEADDPAKETLMSRNVSDSIRMASYDSVRRHFGDTDTLLLPIKVSALSADVSIRPAKF